MTFGEQRQVVPQRKVCEGFGHALDHLHRTFQYALGESHHRFPIFFANLPLHQMLEGLAHNFRYEGYDVLTAKTGTE